MENLISHQILTRFLYGQSFAVKECLEIDCTLSFSPKNVLIIWLNPKRLHGKYWVVLVLGKNPKDFITRTYYLNKTEELILNDHDWQNLRFNGSISWVKHVSVYGFFLTLTEKKYYVIPSWCTIKETSSRNTWMTNGHN